MLAGFGIVIGVADHFAKNIRPLESLTWKHGVLFGLAQALALIPGVSRSGATIAAGLAMGYKREAAAKYAFLLAIPAVVGSGFFKLFDISADPVEPAWGPILLATVVAFGVGLAVIHWLLKYISTHTFRPFVIYRLALAALVAVLLLTGVLPAAAHRLVLPTGDSHRPRSQRPPLGRRGRAASFSSSVSPYGASAAVVTPAAANSASRSASRSLGPSSEVESISSYGTAAIASRGRRDR